MLRNGWKSVACLTRVGLAPRRSCGLAALRRRVGADERAKSLATSSVTASNERQDAKKKEFWPSLLAATLATSSSLGSRVDRRAECTGGASTSERDV
jgi:hypothetical protein